MVEGDDLTVAEAAEALGTSPQDGTASCLPRA
jgi:hypothetical protein